MNETYFQLDHVCKSFHTVKAVNDVSFSIGKGEVHAICGENGAGKSTMMNLIAGVYRIDSGEMRLDGQVYDPKNPADARRAGVSIVFQELSMFSLQTTEMNIFAGKELTKGLSLDHKEMRRRTQQVLDENELIQEVPVALSKQVSTVAVHPAESADAMLPKDLDVSALTRTVTLDNETALAPIAAGDRLGEITVSYGDTTYVTVPLLAVADVSASRFLSLRHAIGEFFSQRSARIAVLALVVLVAALVLWFRFYGRNRRYGKPGSKQYRHHSYRGRRH